MPPLPPFENRKAFLDALETRWQEGLAFRRASDLRAMWNLAFYHGHQWLTEHVSRSETSLKRIEVDDEDPEAPVLLTINKVGNHVRWGIANITQQPPAIECRPVSDEDSDIDTARVGTRISSSEDERLQLETLLPRLYNWVLPVGYAFLQLTWDPDQGRPVDVAPDPDADPDAEPEELYEGNVDLEVVPHYEIVMDPMADDIKKARWCIRTVALTEDEVYERWGHTPKKATKVKVIADVLNELGAPFTPNAPKPSDRIAVRQFWLRPRASRQYPEGLVVTWAGKDVLEVSDPWPYKHQPHLPFIQCNFYPPQGGWWGTTFVSDLIDSQIDYNHARSLEADLNSRLMPKVFYLSGSVRAEETSARVEWIPYDTMPPTPWNFDAGWMRSHEVIQDRADKEMGETSGINEAQMGNLTGTTPGVTALALQEAASKPYAVPAKELARCLKEFGWQRLMLIQQYWREERLVRTWSRAGTLAVERYRGSDVEGQLDVHVSSESALPRSKAARAQLAIQLMTAQIPGFDIRQFVRMMELPGTDVLTEVFDADERHAERENSHLVTRGRGVQIPSGFDTQEQRAEKMEKIARLLPQVSDFDNHEIHMEVHRLHMISPEFEGYPDKVKALFEAHFRAHEMYLATRQQALAAQAGAQAPGGEVPPNGAGTLPGESDLLLPNPTQVAAGQTPQRPTPAITDLAMMGGRAGQPGAMRGVDDDLAAAFIGR